MNDNDFTSGLVRIPGLYRPWELPQLLRLNEAFQIEDAGAHADGTRLLAVYSSNESPFARGLAEFWSADPAHASRPRQDDFAAA